MNTLPVQRASLLATTGPQTQWLIEGLWADQAVGILGGEPKCCKSFLALDLAVSAPQAPLVCDALPSLAPARSCTSPPKTLTREWCEKQGAEVYYAYAVTPWCFITGDLRYVAPLPKELGNALIAAQRLNMRF